MRQKLLLMGLVGALALAVSPVQAFAQTCQGPISWGTTYAYESNYANNISANGSVLTIVGTVNCFSGVFADLNPPANEYSVYITGVSNGTVVTPINVVSRDAYETNYSNVSIEIWDDNSNNAVFTDNPPNADVPSKFRDGTLFLSGVADNLNVLFFLAQGSGNYLGGNFDSGGNLGDVWTGGSAYGRVNVGGKGCPLRLTGGWNVTPSALPPGYTADVEGKIDTDCATPAEPTTWGRLKSLYN